MSGSAVWWIIGAIALGTYLLRLSFIPLWQRLRIPRVVDEALNYVPAAVLAALVLPALLRPEGFVDLSVDNTRLLAGAVAAVVAWYSRSVLATLAAGMGAMWLLQWLV